MRKEGMFKLFGHSRKVVFPVLMSFCMAGAAFAMAYRNAADTGEEAVA